jgi:hypothetical protein
MDVFPNTLQYLQCMNCQKLLGEGSLICELGHPLCLLCGKQGEQCRACSMDTAELKTFVSTLKLNLEIMEILKKSFARCKYNNCKHLFPLYIYEDHVNSCQNIPSKVSCIHGCGIMTKKLGTHLIKKHGCIKEDIIENNILKLYSTSEEWILSTWKEIVTLITYNKSLLICPKIEKDVFSLVMYNLDPEPIRIKVKAKKGWNSLRFKGYVPFYEEKLIKTHDPVFWNCQLAMLKDRFIEFDPVTKKHYLELQILKIN